jgi:hypothetical protein
MNERLVFKKFASKLSNHHKAGLAPKAISGYFASK